MTLQELLNEEANTSLMYYKLFPDQRKIQILGELGFVFKMGDGFKIAKSNMSKRNRSGNVHKHRTIQTIVITHNGQFYREIPKAKWVQLVDPSDKDSKRYGDMFIDKLIDHFSKARDQVYNSLNMKKYD